MQKVVLATGNPGKVNELADLLRDFGMDIVAQTSLGVESAEETGLTFIENAILKLAMLLSKLVSLLLRMTLGSPLTHSVVLRGSIPLAMLVKKQRMNKTCINYSMR